MVDLCSQLADKGLVFEVTLKIKDSFHFSLKSDKKASAQGAGRKRQRGESYRKRQLKRREAFLQKKSGTPPNITREGAKGVKPPSPPPSPPSPPPPPPPSPPPPQPQSPPPSAQNEPSQPISESRCFPSSPEPAILDSNDRGSGHISKKLRLEVQKVPRLKVLIDQRASPKFRIQQLDGNTSLPEEEAFLCDDNQQSEHDDDPQNGQSTSCPNCDQPLLSVSHQCYDSDQQTYIDNFHPRNGQSKENERTLEVQLLVQAVEDINDEISKWAEKIKQK